MASYFSYLYSTLIPYIPYILYPQYLLLFQYPPIKTLDVPLFILTAKIAWLDITLHPHRQDRLASRCLMAMTATTNSG